MPSAQSQALAAFALRQSRPGVRKGSEERADLAPSTVDPHAPSAPKAEALVVPPGASALQGASRTPHSALHTRHSSLVTPHVCYLGAQPSPSPTTSSSSSLPPSSLSFIPSSSSSPIRVHPCPSVVEASSSTLHPLPSSSSFHLLYLGAMGRFYDIETLLQTMRLAKANGQNWHATLAGTDPDKLWLKRAKELGLGEAVDFPGYLQGDAFTACMSRAHVGIVPMDPRSGVAIPYKACSYLASGLPIISSLPGELNDLLTRSGAGLRYTFGNPESLYQQIHSFASDPERLTQARHAAKTLFETHFNREITYPLWTDWLENLHNLKSESFN